MFSFLKKQDYSGAYWVMFLAAIPAFIAAVVLSIEKVHLLKNPDAVLSCSINLVLNCASVMKTWQSELFGFPNSFIGIAGFAIVISVAIGALLGNAKYARIYLLTAQFFYTLGLVFAYWLFFQSVYVIQVLCPWCLLVTAMTTLIFASLLHINLRENNFKLSKSVNKKIQAWLDKDFDKLEVAVWLVLMAVLVIVKFGDGLFS